MTENNFLNVNVCNLDGQALDYAVAICEGGIYEFPSARASFWMWPGDNVRYSKSMPSYSTDWGRSGPILEREQIDVYCYQADPPIFRAEIQSAPMKRVKGQAETYLKAALRALVEHKLGPVIKVPEEYVENRNLNLGAEVDRPARIKP